MNSGTDEAHEDFDEGNEDESIADESFADDTNEIGSIGIKEEL